MPLLDHFRPPVREQMEWSSFHSNWATRIADRLTELVPTEFRVEEHPRLAGGVEIDVAATRTSDPMANGSQTSPWHSEWRPGPAAGVMAALFPDKFEVLVFRFLGGRQLVAAIELVSPGNKDRPETRSAFTAKIASYLHDGVGVLVVDVATERRANLHNELIEFMGGPASLLLPPDTDLYAASYRPVKRVEATEIDVWHATFSVGDPLPTMPLRLIADYFVPVELEATYTEACRRRRLI
jgi:hypothetical protein